MFLLFSIERTLPRGTCKTHYGKGEIGNVYLLALSKAKRKTLLSPHFLMGVKGASQPYVCWVNQFLNHSFVKTSNVHLPLGFQTDSTLQPA